MAGGSPRQGDAPSSGVLIVDKPQGVTSHDVVAAARKALSTKRVGHAGTLDPMATGVLVLGFGHATRLLTYIVDHDKSYEATIRLGQETTTDDAEGECTAQRSISMIAYGQGDARSADSADSADMDEHGWRTLIEQAIAAHFLGRIEQVPSTYSAIKVNGRRAYDLARAGERVELEPRVVTISEFGVLGVQRAAVAGATGQAAGTGGDAAQLLDVRVRVTCSSGTYIRSLARDLGRCLGVGGHLTHLRRIRVGRFELNDPKCVEARAESRTSTARDGQPVTRVKALLPYDGADLAQHVLSMGDAVRRTMPTIQIGPHEAGDLRFGRRIARPVLAPSACVTEDDEVVAIVDAAGPAEAKPIVVFPAA